MFKNKKLNKGIEQIKRIELTDHEKSQIFEYVKNSHPIPNTTIHTPIKSPWVKYLSVFNPYKHQKAYYSLASCLVIILSGKEIVYASEGSLPGDILYPIKVSIVEPLHTTFTRNASAKAEYESSLTIKRLTEAEQLASENKLDSKKQQQLNSLIEQHTNALSSELHHVHDSKEVDTLVTNFQSGMNAHARVIEIMNSTTDSDPKDTNDVSDHARISATKIRSDFRSTQNTTDTYTKRKKEIESMLDSTDTLLLTVTPDNSPVKQKVIHETQKTITEARGFLKKVDEDTIHHSNVNTHDTLLNSESSAKEASLFLKTGLRIKETKQNNDRNSEQKQKQDRSNHR